MDKTKKINEVAEHVFERYAKDYVAAILLNARLEAFRENSEEIQLRHIETAIEKLNQPNKRAWTKDLLITVGGALFGAFIQGFITELSNGKPILVTIYVLLGLIGMFLVFMGLNRQ